MNREILRQVTGINWKIDPDKVVEVAIDLLKAVEESEYIPFTSPSPSTTETRIKALISGCRSGLEIVQGLMNSIKEG